MIELGLSKIRPEKRQGDYTDLLVRTIQAQAASMVDTSGTAAVEAAAGALSRAFAAAEVSGPSWAVQAISPAFLGQVGRELVRAGQSLHVIDVTPEGGVSLLPASDWDFEDGEPRPESWTVRATVNGPRSLYTRYMPFSGVVFVAWGNVQGQAFAGRGALSWAHHTAKLQSETERSLGDEASGPLANIIPYPQDGGDNGDNDPLKSLKADIRAARGKALLVETTAAGMGEGRSAAPLKDWKAERLGPNPPASMDAVMGRGFVQMLAALGVPPGLFVDRSDGTAQRESMRRYFSLTVEPLAGLLARELSAKLETAITLNFSGRFAADLAGRARAFQSMVGAGMDLAKAAALAGLMVPEG